VRQAIFVVVLVAAAFLGGAMVNGPGIRWVQARLLDYMGLKDGGEIASIDLPPVSSGSADPYRRAGAPTRTEPLSGGAGLGTELASKPNDGKSLDKSLSLAENTRANPVAGAPSTNTSRTELQGSPPPLPVPTSVPEPEAPRLGESHDQSELVRNSGPLHGAAASPATGSARESAVRRTSSASLPVPIGGKLKDAQVGHTPHPDLDGSDTSGPSPAPLDPSVGPALLASLSPSSQAQPGKTERAKTDTIPLEVAPMSSPSGSSQAPSSTPSGSIPRPFGAAGESGAEWTGLRQKLQLLGVTRYMIEGELHGRVVFSCLIPLAGRQAVSQRFEAEGDDEFQAARVAIRRISLWQATRSSPLP